MGTSFGRTMAGITVAARGVVIKEEASTTNMFVGNITNDSMEDIGGIGLQTSRGLKVRRTCTVESTIAEGTDL